MRSSSDNRAGRLWRAVLLVPLLTGVIAMHVLLLCASATSGGDPMAGHAGHDVVAASGPPVAAAATDVGSPDTAHGALAVCLAVLVTVLVLTLAGSSWRDRGTRATLRRRVLAGRLTRTHPPPRISARLLLCVSRT